MSEIGRKMIERLEGFAKDLESGDSEKKHTHRRPVPAEQQRVPYTRGEWQRCGGLTAEFMAIATVTIDPRDCQYIVFEMAHPGILEHGVPIACPDNKTQQANAQLMAAAPNLLEALQWYLEHDAPGGADDAFFHAGRDRAEKAVAKALGRKRDGNHSLGD